MAKFNIGDIIRGNEQSAGYGITTKDAVMEVVNIPNYGIITVKLLAVTDNHENPHHIGGEFSVDERAFDLINLERTMITEKTKLGGKYGTISDASKEIFLDSKEMLEASQADGTKFSPLFMQHIKESIEAGEDFVVQIEETDLEDTDDLDILITLKNRYDEEGNELDQWISSEFLYILESNPEPISREEALRAMSLDEKLLRLQSEEFTGYKNYEEPEEELEEPEEEELDEEYYEDYEEEDDEFFEEELYEEVIHIEEPEEEPEPVIDEDRVAYIMVSNAITLSIDGNIQLIDSTHPKYYEVIEAIENKEFLKASKLMNIKEAIEEFSKGALKIVGNNVSYKGMEISNALTKKITKLMAEGNDTFEAFASFMAKVMENPSKTRRERLISFVSADDININANGNIVAYKSVDESYYPSRAGMWALNPEGDFHYFKDEYYNNSIGSVCAMPRSECDDDDNNTCSTGLHACSWHYLKACWGTDNKIMAVEIEPNDVVSIPVDYKDSKLRCCRYKVLCELTQEEVDKLNEL